MKSALQYLLALAFMCSGMVAFAAKDIEAPILPEEEKYWIVVAIAEWRDQKGVGQAEIVMVYVRATLQKAIDQVKAKCAESGHECTHESAKYKMMTSTGCLFAAGGWKGNDIFWLTASSANEAKRLCNKEGVSCKRPVGTCVKN